MTVQQIFDRCYAKHWSRLTSKWGSDVVHFYNRNIRDVLGPLDAAGLTPQQIREWHKGLESTPMAANRSLEVLSRLFSFAAEEGLLPWDRPNPCRFVRSYTERKRERVASEAELRKLGALLLERSKRYPRQAAMVVLMALTGARPQSLASLPLKVVKDGESMFLEFDGKSTSKTGVKERIVIPPLALKILEDVPRDKGFLIGKVRYREFWEEIRSEAGCPDLWARDLRRTFATCALDEGVPMSTISELLNHSNLQTTRTYTKLTPRARVTAVELVSNKMARMMELIS